MAEMWQLVSEITLGSAITIVGTIAVILAFVFRWYGKDKEWEEPILDCNKRIDGLERRIDGISYPQQHYSSQVADLKETSKKQEERIDRLTNLLIDYFSSRQPNETKTDDKHRLIK